MHLLLNKPLLYTLLLLCLGRASLCAQEPASAAEPPPSAATLTLHVYAAHVQVPALVLSPGLQQLPALGADQFRIRLDRGAAFPPSAVRPEGDDPLTLAILLDAGGDTHHLVKDFGPTLIRLRTSALRPHDRLLLYAVDCETIRFPGTLPQDPAGVEGALHLVLGAPQLHRGSTLPVCGGSLRLWDTLASMVRTLGTQPGRRVVVVLSAGHDHGSRAAWTAVRAYAALQSVALFGLTRPGLVFDPGASESPLWNLCALTGGLLLPVASPRDLPQRMDALVDMLRHRYILEFARPNQLSSGAHTLEVEITRSPQALVRLTGLSAPVLDQALRDDPSTVPYLEADKPPVGTRPPLTPVAPPR